MYYFYCFFNFVVDMPTNQEIYGDTSENVYGVKRQEEEITYVLLLSFFVKVVVDMPTNQEIYGHTSKQACGWSKQTGV